MKVGCETACFASAGGRIRDAHGHKRHGVRAMKRLAVVAVVMVPGMVLMGAGRVCGETFSLYQIYQYALQQSEDVKIAKEDFHRAEQERRRARSVLTPQITVAGTYSRSPEKTTESLGSEVLLQPHEGYGGEVTVKQSLFAGGRNMANVRLAGRGVEVAQESYDAATEAFLLRVANAFYGMLKAQKNREARQHNVERLMELRRLAEVRFRVGEVGEAVVLRAEAELASAEATLVAAENELVVQQGELQVLAGLPDMFDVEEPPLPETPSETLEALTDIAFQYRDDVTRSRLEERMAQERVSMARGNLIPNLTLQGSYFHRDQDPRSTFFIKDSWLVEGRVEFPIFDGGLRLAELAQARSEAMQRQWQTVKVKKEIFVDVTKSYNTLHAATRVLETREKQLGFAARNYEIVSKQFAYGVATHIDLLDANQALVEAERDAIASRYDQHLAILDLQRSAGVFLSMTSRQ